MAVAVDPQYSRDAARVLSIVSDDFDTYAYMQRTLSGVGTFEQLPPRAQQIWRAATASAERGQKMLVRVKPYIRDGHPVSGYQRDAHLVVGATVRILSREDEPHLNADQLAALYRTHDKLHGLEGQVRSFGGGKVTIYLPSIRRSFQFNQHAVELVPDRRSRVEISQSAYEKLVRDAGISPDHYTLPRDPQDALDTAMRLWRSDFVYSSNMRAAIEGEPVAPAFRDDKRLHLWAAVLNEALHRAKPLDQESYRIVPALEAPKVGDQVTLKAAAVGFDRHAVGEFRGTFLLGSEKPVFYEIPPSAKGVTFPDGQEAIIQGEFAVASVQDGQVGGQPVHLVALRRLGDAKSTVRVKPYLREGHPVAGYDRTLFNRLTEPLQGLTIKFEQVGGSQGMPQIFRYMNVDNAAGGRVGMVEYGFDRDGHGIDIRGIAVKDTMRGRGIAVAMCARLHEQYSQPLIHGSFSSLEGVRFGIFMAAAYPEWNKLWLDHDEHGNPVFWKPGEPIRPPSREGASPGTFGPLSYGLYELAPSVIEQALADADKARSGSKDAPDGDVKAKVDVRPYIREGHPVVGYTREQALAEQLVRSAEELIRGGRRRGKGRRGLKLPRAGWRDHVEQEHRTLFPLQQGALLRQRSEAMVTRSGGKPWTHVPRDDGLTEYRQGNYRLVYGTQEHGGVIVTGADVYEGDRHLGWTRTEPGLSAQETLERIVPDARSAENAFLDAWWGAPGRPGLYQRMSGDPGVKFEEQHQRILEAGARMDAELTYRTRAETKAYREVTKQRSTLIREMDAKVRDADRMQAAVAYSLLTTEYGWLPEITVDDIRRREAAFQREIVKGSRAEQGIVSANFDVHMAWQRASLSEPVMQILEEHGKLADQASRLAADENAAYRRLVNARRDSAYEMLSEVRPFGTVPLDYAPTSAVGSAALHAAQFWLPSDWIAASNASERKLAVLWTDSRGQYQHVAPAEHGFTDEAILTVSPSDSPDVPLASGASAANGVGTALHELVHRSEAVRDGIKGAEWTFYTSRVSPGVNQQWEPTVSLRDLTGNTSYREHEVTRPDDFVNPYSGKDYGNGYPDMQSDYEILSMGIEDLVTGQHKMLVQDDEYRQFVLGSLALL